MRTYTEDELREILKLHKKWLFGEDRGSRADLYMANLSRADLYMADLSRANLYMADLSEANLYMADLYMADLSEANLTGANLYMADLSRANLTGANLKEKIKIKSKKYAYYQGSDYYCMFFGPIIKIGCEVHYRKDWENFCDNRILDMDQGRALKFWKREKNIVISISKHLTNSR